MSLYIYSVRNFLLYRMWDITNGIKVDPRPWCEGLFGPTMGICLFGLAIPCDIMRTLCLHREGEMNGGKVFVMSHME